MQTQLTRLTCDRCGTRGGDPKLGLHHETELDFCPACGKDLEKWAVGTEAGAC